MLLSLQISNLAIIESMDIDFDKGLNIITGETGSGKSILLNSILLLLGKKVNPKEIVRFGAEKGEVVAILSQNEDDELLVRREIYSDGKNKIYLNNKLSTISEVKDILRNFIEFSAQNENQLLFDKKKQLELLDTFGGLNQDLDNYRDVFTQYRDILSQIDSYNSRSRELSERADLIRFQYEQLSNANLDDPYEDEKIKRDIEIAENYEKIKNVLKNSYNEINGSERAILKRIINLKNQFNEVSELKETFKEIAKLLDEVAINLDEASKIIVSEGSIDEEHLSIDKLYHRADLLKSLKKRFNKQSLSDLILLRDKLSNDIKSIDNVSIDIEELNAKKSDKEQSLTLLSEKLRRERLKTKDLLEDALKSYLAELKMEKVDFSIIFRQLEDFTPSGRDEIEFTISPNAGEPLKSLEKIASGGELSRIMLAIKGIFSDYLSIPVLIFDEVDSGTGGETAFAIGKKLKKISEKHQVIAITHLPQVAAFSNVHFKIAKRNIDGRVVSEIKKLSESDKVNEIARMISGNQVTDISIKSAKEMIQNAV